MKDRYAQSSMRKQTNRMTFGEVSVTTSGSVPTLTRVFAVD